uniref:Secreted protein n=1 Tax=Parascaris univalens TaxID=6257 RepID=A0A914ZIS9_PARUN
MRVVWHLAFDKRPHLFAFTVCARSFRVDVQKCRRKQKKKSILFLQRPLWTSRQSLRMRSKLKSLQAKTPNRCAYCSQLDIT